MLNRSNSWKEEEEVYYSSKDKLFYKVIDGLVEINSMEGFISEYMFSNDCFYTKIYSARKDELESINVDTLNFIEPEDGAFTFTINKFL